MGPEPGYRRAPPAGEGAAGVRPLLVRHANAVRKDRRVDDVDRQPSERGRGGDAPRTGRRLAGSGLEPDFVLRSPPRRTRRTGRLAASALEDPPPGPAGTERSTPF
ncbi:hypothetical protein [Streptomyces sp. NPDC004267]|uniref:hypothetical protein n=1 Tax=Streptomyces sp. NPDC004267 TaxID=3364694 RepID=UPI0036C06AB3